MKTVYIAGPMRGLPNYNFDEFDKAKHSKVLEKFDRIISPADLDRAIEGWAHYPPEQIVGDMKRFALRDVIVLFECDAIYLLKGWQDSKGARAEKAVAEWLGLEIIEQ